MQLNPCHLWIVIPCYNNSRTIRDVAQRTLKVWPNVVVVDDGSTDARISELLKDLPLQVISHAENEGKGNALISAARFVFLKGGVYMLTLDADGQHFPEDIPLFLERLPLEGDKIFIGVRDFTALHIPSSSRFGRDFSNYWIKMETGLDLEDTQSGYRAYPVNPLLKIKLRTHAYDFEIECLVKLVWAGFTVEKIPIRVFYPPASERVSHFKPFWDNLKISMTHTRLILRKLIWWEGKKWVKPSRHEIKKMMLNPVSLFKRILHENDTPAGLATAAFVGVFIGVVPIMGFHIIAILYISLRLHLNLIVTLGIQNIAMPPLVPGLCILTGYYLRTGQCLTDWSFSNLCQMNRVWEWFLGSLVVAPVMAVFFFFLVFFTARKWGLHKRLTEGKV